MQCAQSRANFSYFSLPEDFHLSVCFNFDATAKHVVYDVCIVLFECTVYMKNIYMFLSSILFSVSGS